MSKKKTVSKTGVVGSTGIAKFIKHLDGVRPDSMEYNQLWIDSLFARGSYLNPLMFLEQLRDMVETTVNDPAYVKVKYNETKLYWLNKYLLGDCKISISYHQHQIESIVVIANEALCVKQVLRMALDGSTIWEYIPDAEISLIVRYLESVLNLYRAHLMALKTK